MAFMIGVSQTLFAISAEGELPRWLAWAGVVGCAVLALSVPMASVVAGAGVLRAGVGVWAVRRRVVE